MLKLETALSSSFVLLGVRLLDSTEKINAFGRHVGAGEVQIITAQVGEQEAVQIVRLGKDRIELELSGPQPETRSVVRAEYPELSEPERLAEVAQFAVKASELGDEFALTAVGYNIDLVYVMAEGPASGYIADRLIVKDFANIKGMSWQLAGGAARLIFKDEHRIRNLVIEPRLNDPTTHRLFFSMNLHVPTTSIPSRDEIAASLQGVWNDSKQFMDYFNQDVSI